MIIYEFIWDTSQRPDRKMSVSDYLSEYDKFHDALSQFDQWKAKDAVGAAKRNHEAVSFCVGFSLVHAAVITIVIYILFPLLSNITQNLTVKTGLYGLRRMNSNLT